VYAGDSNEVLMVEFKEVDFLMSCPPYADEKYSDDQRTYLTWTMLTSKRFTSIIKISSSLKQDRFACFVVGDVRDKRILLQLC
jgi:hypothetical protein